MSELKPCPFCGSDAELVVEQDHHGEFFKLGCSMENCCGHWAYYTESVDDTPIADAIAAWNRRAKEDV